MTTPSREFSAPRGRRLVAPAETYAGNRAEPARNLPERHQTFLAAVVPCAWKRHQGGQYAVCSYPRFLAQQRLKTSQHQSGGDEEERGESDFADHKGETDAGDERRQPCGCRP